MSCHKCVGALPAAGLSRRAVLNRFGMGLGGLAVANLINPPALAAFGEGQDRGVLGGQFHVKPRAKRVIYLFMAGGPSQMETFDYKPILNQRNGEQLPDSVRQGQRLTGMSGNQSSLPLAGSQFGFTQHGAHGTWVVEEYSGVLGWISAGPSRDIDALSSTSEVWAIYVDPNHWRRGVGQCLWDEVERQLKRSGFSDVTLWVLQENAGALAFYRSNGFVVDGLEKTIELGGTELVEIRLRKGLVG